MLPPAVGAMPAPAQPLFLGANALPQVATPPPQLAAPLQQAPGAPAAGHQQDATPMLSSSSP
eukprot:3356451-Alexandrium_andersonii.AAC.1